MAMSRLVPLLEFNHRAAKSKSRSNNRGRVVPLAGRGRDHRYNQNLGSRLEAAHELFEEHLVHQPSFFAPSSIL
jgi:hypothetical protein